MIRTFTNGVVFDGSEFVNGATVVVRDDQIVDVHTNTRSKHEGEVIDLLGTMIAPGFIDLQVNGGGDVLFNDTPTVEGLRCIVDAHARFGTTSMFPTFITGPIENMRAARDAAIELSAQVPTAVLGIHFEGPSISYARVGAHDRSFVEAAFPIDLIFASSDFRYIVTLAPEVVNDSLVSRLAALGVKVSIGHSAATYAEASLAISHGASMTTHLFNAMSQLTAREPGVVGTALADDTVTVGLIVDGHHCHYASISVAWKAKPRGRCVLVTDAMPPVGGTSDRYCLASSEIRVINGRPVTADGTLAGSVLDMATAVRNAVNGVGIPIAEALRMASLYAQSCCPAHPRGERARSLSRTCAHLRLRQWWQPGMLHRLGGPDGTKRETSGGTSGARARD